jgi:signal transduction histidine kinase
LLLEQLIDRARELKDVHERLRKLQVANRSIVGELSLPGVLARIVAAARDLVGARYAALGVIAADGSLEQFIHVGMDVTTVATIGELPKGRGLLGALVADPQPIRLSRISDDERSSGFPPGHPAMHSFLGVPIRSRDAVYGNLYLTEHPNGAFAEHDTELVLALAATAGIAIENARLYEESVRRQRWLQASAEVSSLLIQQADVDQLKLIVGNFKRLAQADAATLVIPTEKPGMLRVKIVADGEAHRLVGMEYRAQGSLVGAAMETGRGVRIGDYDASQQYFVHIAQVMDLGPVMTVPLSGASGPRGALTVARTKGGHPFDAADMEMAEAYAGYAAIAMELVDARIDQQRLAVLEDRDRIARDLHDHVIQRMFAAGLQIQSAVAGLGRGAQAERLGRVVEDIDETIRQIRSSIFALHDSAAVEFGLRSAVLSVTNKAVDALGFDPSVQFIGPIDTVVPSEMVSDVEAVVREGLANVARHAHATEVSIMVVAGEAGLTVTVADNGIGLAETARRSGLENLRQRAVRWSGSFEIAPRQPDGLLLSWNVPLPDGE